jgi:hypothetical protein
MRRPPLVFDASSSKAFVQSSVTEGKLDNSRVTPSGVPGLVHDSVKNKRSRRYNSQNNCSYHAEFEFFDSDISFNTSS